LEKILSNNSSYLHLRELAEKPILLELMVETLPQIKIEENKKVNHASLYDRYTKFWLQRMIGEVIYQVMKENSSQKK